MRRKHEKQNDLERNENIVKYGSILIGILFVVAVVLFAVSSNIDENTYIEYSEKSNVDYNVFLKENNYYKTESIGANNQYIASLIDYISANFNYDIELQNSNEQYNYTYRIDATVTVTDNNTSNIIYTNTDTLVEEKTLNMTGNKANINENLKIDYNTYNNLITGFIKDYSLNESNSVLEVSLYVNTLDDKIKKETSLYVPLTTKTVAIDIENDAEQISNQQILISQNVNPLKTILLIAGIMVLSLNAFLIYKLVKYILKTRTDESIYNSKKRGILINYGGYIEQVDNYDFKTDTCQIIKVNKFVDLLKIKDELSKPILMIENKENNSTMFIIPDSSSYIYMFTLNIEQELLAEKNPVYSGVGGYNEGQ